MSRRADPQRLDEARRIATRNRLMGAGLTDASADALMAAWEAREPREMRERGGAYWAEAWEWIVAERNPPGPR